MYVSHNSPFSSGYAMIKMLDSGLEVRDFEIQSHYYIHFRFNTLMKGMNSLTP